MILKPFIHKFRNNEFIQFIKNVLNAIQHRNPEHLNVKDEYDKLDNLSGEICNLYKPDRGSDITLELQELDERRDEAFNGIYKFLDGLTYYFDEEQSEAARQLFDTLLIYGGGIARLNYQAETSTISSIINKWRTTPDLAVALSKLDSLKEWVDELDEANRVFDDVYMKRVREVASQPDIKMAGLRKEIIGVFRMLMKKIEAFAVISEDEIYEQTAREINEVINGYNQLVVNRSSSGVDSEEKTE